MTQQYPHTQPQVYGQNAQADSNTLPGQNDPSGARASMEAALADQRERTGYAPGESPAQTSERDGFGQLSTLEMLEAEAEKDITNFKVMDVPGDYRPGWSFVVDCILTGTQLDRYTTQSKKKGARGADAEVDATQLNCRILLNHVTEIRKDGQALLDDKGKPVRLNSPEFIRSMKRDTAVEAIRRFLWDSHIGQLTDRIMVEAGYVRNGGEYVQVSSVDPTHG